MNIKKIVFVLVLVIFCQRAYSSDIDKMIGQKILVGFGAGSEAEKVYKYARQGKITGVIFFERDIKSPLDLMEKTTKLKATKGIPLFISIDQEGGYIQRMNSRNGFKDYKTSYELSKGSLNNAYAQYKTMAQELKYYGFNLNFAPCVDLIIDKESIINKKERAYSWDPYVVTLFAKEAIKAYNESNIIVSLKHFPGHGSVKGDTHLGFVDASETWTDRELIPYKNLSLEKGLETVMVAHVFNKNIDSKYPASLSKNTISMLRQYFDGVVISDDYDMRAIKNNYSLEEIVVNAINADIDILMFSNYSGQVSVDEIHKIIKKAIKEGKITKEQIHKSNDRIMKLKKNFYL